MTPDTTINHTSTTRIGPPATTGPVSTFDLGGLRSWLVSADIEADAEDIGFHAYESDRYLTIKGDGPVVVLVRLPEDTHRLLAVMAAIDEAIADGYAGTFVFKAVPFSSPGSAWTVWSATYRAGDQ